ncbi:berberine bridge enzyme-like 22 [Olea europaea var. sylvestris]|uniref:berberine bridge enzyme-like 22 n=1 Tax=Olea europaea var. sylvestris TaxID=158386 RepID=UPI000C1CE2FC|nr:berberine bridge enzyme-like 22 [Olea europaea var. sylvestris]
MGEDLFWAIRGRGRASFGIIVAWKIKLVQVPPVVTVFTIRKKMDLEGTKLVHKWQHIANNLPKELFIRVIIQSPGIDSKDNEKTVKALFNSLFLGPVNELLPIMDKSFPELGLQAEDCIEMSWIESILHFPGYERGQTLEVLLDRTVHDESYFKAKSDFVEEPIPKSAWEKVREMFLDGITRDMILDPFGGRMDEISESELPFPHRKGNLYNKQYLSGGRRHFRLGGQ